MANVRTAHFELGCHALHTCVQRSYRECVFISVCMRIGVNQQRVQRGVWKSVLS